MKWIFAYGSLLWRPGFEFKKKKKASVLGWERRLWHSSTDHRGTPDLPGRVAAIVPMETGVCEGLVYGISDSKWEETIEYLDEREKNGYESMLISVDVEGLGLMEAITYRSKSEEGWVVLDEKDEELIYFFLNAAGESGKNLDYLMTLGSTLDQLGIKDRHVSSLRRMAKENLGVERN